MIFPYLICPKSTTLCCTLKQKYCLWYRMVHSKFAFGATKKVGNDTYLLQILLFKRSLI